MYNVEAFIGKCLRSVAGSNYVNIEIICVDDGSTDSTVSVVERFLAEDSRIYLFRQSSAGVSAARNRGLQESKGKYIAFVDADDWVSKDYLSVLYEIAYENRRISSDVSL